MIAILRRLTLAGTCWPLPLLLTAGVLPSTLAAQALTYPPAHRDSVADDYHGTRVADPYRWLEQPDSGRSPGWLKAQKSLTTASLSGISSPRAAQRRLFSCCCGGGLNAPRAISRIRCIRGIRVPPLNLDGRMAPLDPSAARAALILS
jgi:hypothetical protein